jgi:hypothetical protein
MLLVALAPALPGVELTGVPVPGVFGETGWSGYLGNDAFGPGGGGAEDDFRTGYGGIGWQDDHLAVVLDYSVLTSQNPSRSPVRWGEPNPFAGFSNGAARSDEISLGMDYRWQLAGQDWATWWQAGPGLQLSGDLGGSELQNDVHGALFISANGLPYEHPSLQAAGYLQVGGGGTVVLGGPVSGIIRALALESTRGWTRWQLEGGLMVHGPGAGIWAMMRQDGFAGHALTRTADSVAQHESGLSLVVGVSVVIVAGVELGVETSHNLGNDGQDGAITLATTTDDLLTGHGAALAEGQPWQARFGLSSNDTLVPGHGADIAVGTTPMDVPSWLQLICGLRDQRLTVPYDFDVSGYRLLLWAGAAAEPQLFGGPAGGIYAHVEGGVGYRISHLSSTGQLAIDGRTSLTTQVALLRAAGGLQASYNTGHGTIGVLALLEAVAAPRRSADLEVLATDDLSVVVKTDHLLLDGSSIGLLLALESSWTW